MTEQEKPKGWGSKERMALVAEVLRQKRMVKILVWLIQKNMLECPPNKFWTEECSKGAGCEACWMRFVEQAVADEISPEEQV